MGDMIENHLITPTLRRLTGVRLKPVFQEDTDLEATKPLFFFPLMLISCIV